MAAAPKPLYWVGSSRKDLSAMPADVQDVFGYALHLAEMGDKHAQAKPLQGFGSSAVLEVVEDEAGSTYRAVYTVRIKGRVYVLHCFQKKSVKGIKTPKPDIDLIKQRLRAAEEDARSTNHED